MFFSDTHHLQEFSSVIYNRPIKKSEKLINISNAFLACVKQNVFWPFFFFSSLTYALLTGSAQYFDIDTILIVKSLSTFIFRASHASLPLLKLQWMHIYVHIYEIYQCQPKFLDWSFCLRLVQLPSTTLILCSDVVTTVDFRFSTCCMLSGAWDARHYFTRLAPSTQTEVRKCNDSSLLKVLKGPA